MKKQLEYLATERAYNVGVHVRQIEVVRVSSYTRKSRNNGGYYGSTLIAV